MKKFLISIFLLFISINANAILLSGGSNIPPPPLVLNSIANNQLYQRDPGNTTSNVPFIGTRSTTNIIQGKILLVSNNSIIVDWSTVGNSGGDYTYSGTLVTPSGGPYYRQLRDSSSPSTIITDNTPFSVGVIVGMYGQSNAEYFMGQQTAPVPNANAGTWVYVDGVGWVTSGSSAANTASAAGNGVRQLLNDIQTYTGAPTGIVFGGQAATSLAGLIQGTSPYNIYASRITASGGKMEAQFWSQGESDAAAHTPEADYLNSLSTQLYTPLVTLIGRTRAQFPFLLSSLASYDFSGNGTETGWGPQQTTLEHAGSQLVGIIYSHTNIDAPHQPGDDLHWNGIGQQNSAARFAETYSNFLGISAHKSGWFSTVATRIDNTHTRVTLVQSAGTGYTPISPNQITGFFLSSTAWANYITPSSVSQFDATHVDITHSDLGTVTKLLRYQYGAHPNTSSGIFDNSSLTVPLNYTADDLIVVGSTPTPAPIYITTSGTATFPILSQAKFTGIGVGAPAVTTPSGQRFLIVMISRQSGGTSLNSFVIQKAGQSDITLTSGSGLTTLGNITAGQSYVAFAALPDAYGFSVDFVLSFSANLFSTPMVHVFVVDKSTLNSLIPNSTAFSTSSSTTTISSSNFSAADGSFTLVAAQNNSTGSPINIADNAAVTLYNYNTLLSPVAGVFPIEGLATNVISGSTNIVSANYISSANLVIGVTNWR